MYRPRLDLQHPDRRRWASLRTGGRSWQEADGSNLAPGVVWCGSQDLKIPNKKVSTFVPNVFLYYRKCGWGRKWLKSQFFGQKLPPPNRKLFWLGCKVFSDHSNLKYFKVAKYLTPKQVKWACFVDSFNMHIFHKAGQNNPADGPSWQEDYVWNRKPIHENKLIQNKLVFQAVIKQHPNSIHDLLFQKPSLDLLNYFNRSYSSRDQEESTREDNDGVLWY